jgi:hypothetical protein
LQHPGGCGGGWRGSADPGPARGPQCIERQGGCCAPLVGCHGQLWVLWRSCGCCAAASHECWAAPRDCFAPEALLPPCCAAAIQQPPPCPAHPCAPVPGPCRHLPGSLLLLPLLLPLLLLLPPLTPAPYSDNVTCS